MSKKISASLLVCLPLLSSPALAHDIASTTVEPMGRVKTGATRSLELGAKVLQRTTPMHGFDVYLVGFHPMKANPEMQMKAHHFCHQVNEDFAQCVLFDSNSAEANMNGVEYIISEAVFEALPEEEKKYWHPHNGEILSGQLVAPGLPSVAEKALMKSKMNSYGKTWHVWNTGHHGHAGDVLPLGDPRLAWSFNREGEANPDMIIKRDKKLNVDTSKKRKERAELTSLAKPQSGVDTLKEAFKAQTQAIPGVRSQHIPH